MCVCLGADTCVRERDRKRIDTEGENRWKKNERLKNSILAFVVFECSFFTNSSSFPLQFSWRQCIDFILGLSYHLAAFHSSVFIKQGEQGVRE